MSQITCDGRDIEMYQNDCREPAKKAFIDGREERLRLVGWGSTCLVYEVESDGSIVKEFYPVLRQFLPGMKRERIDGREMLIPVEFVGEKDDLRRAMEKCRHRFEHTEEVVKDIYAEYRELGGNMAIIPKPASSDSGLWQRCAYTGGRVLKDHLKERREVCDRRGFFLAVLDAIYKLLNDLIVYHNRGYVNLDVKPENLYAVRGDVELDREGCAHSTLASVRNLDFSSARRVEELLDGILATAAASALRGENLLAEISSEYFATTDRYYHQKTVWTAIRRCISEYQHREEQLSELRRLDAIAVLKVMMYALLDELELSDTASYVDEECFLQGMLKAYFEKGTVSETENLFEDYDVYWRLYDLIWYVCWARDLSLLEVRSRIGDVLFMLGWDPAPGVETAEERMARCDLHRAFARSSAMLEKKGIRTVMEIEDFCYKNKLGVPTAPGELNYFLVTGHRYTKM